MIRLITATQPIEIGAVLDLKSAYEKEPRNILMDTVKLKVPQLLHGMIAAAPQPLEVVTKEDDTYAIGKIPRG